MGRKRKYIIAVNILIIIMSLFSMSLIPIPQKIDFDKSEAEKLLIKIYGPLEDFGRKAISMGEETEGNEVFAVPENIRDKEDFIHLFNDNIKDNTVETFYKELITEREGKLYIDKTVYIPNIYTPSAAVTDSYIRKYRSVYSIVFNVKEASSENLVIKESWKISGQWHGRKNVFIKNENGKWILDYFDGTGMYGFGGIADNPWR